MTAATTLQKLAKLGQSPWYDNVERRLLMDGSIRRLIEMGVLGVTSNPTIFEKAINGSTDYDEDISRLLGAGKAAREIYDELTMKDIDLAADLFKGIYEKSAFKDGFVSIEVLPEYAHDAVKTIDHARQIFKVLNRPNIMIKIPATEEAGEAIEALTADGINVNATLIFSLSHYESAARSYINGLRRFIQKGGGDARRVNSVASVFVSRIDTAVDKLLDEKNKKDLRGKAAVANSVLIYKKFKEIFFSADFSPLKKKKANIQRPLWASTSAKDPSYSDLKYVEGLIAPFTVNTLPHATVEAFIDHGKPKRAIQDSSFKEAEKVIDGLKTLGIDIDRACEEIQAQGIKSFQASFDGLISSIEKKMAKEVMTR